MTMSKYLCHVKNEETGFETDKIIIEANNEDEAIIEYYNSHPNTGFEGDECFAKLIEEN